jgi:hypothetical protein
MLPPLRFSVFLRTNVMHLIRNAADRGWARMESLPYLYRWRNCSFPPTAIGPSTAIFRAMAPR